MAQRSKYRLSLPLLAIGTIATLALGPVRAKLRHSVDRQRQSERIERRPSADRSAEARRGRSASSPWEISWRGWKDILLRTYGDINDDRLLAVAAGLVFFVLLAIFPGIGALVSLYALFADPATINDHLSTIASVMPADSFKLVSGEVTRIASKSTGTLGLASVFGLLFALWSANAGTKAVFDGLNVAHEEKEKRGFIRLNLISFAFTIGAIFFMLVAAAAVVVVPLIFAAIGLEDVLAKLLSALRWPILFVIVAIALAVLYRYGPSRGEPKWRWVTPGSLAASLLWLIVSGLFSFYLAHFANYNATYGSLGALIGLLMWLWLTFLVILAGAELDSEIEHQTAPSTVGLGKPLGKGGAETADTVGKAQSE
jgi:membrane protein